MRKCVVVALCLMSVLFVITGCVGVDYQTELQIYRGVEVSKESRVLGDIVMSLYHRDIREANIPIISTEQPKGEFYTRLLGIDTDVHTEYVVKLGDGGTTTKGRETIVIVKEVPGYEIEVLSGMVDWCLDISNKLDEKGKEKLEKQTILTQEKGYSVLIISERAQLVYDEIFKGIERGSAESVRSVLWE